MDYLAKSTRDNKMTFSDTLRAWCESTGHTAKSAGEFFGISPRTVEDWLQGRRIPDNFKRGALEKKMLESENSA